MIISSLRITVKQTKCMKKITLILVLCLVGLGIKAQTSKSEVWKKTSKNDLRQSPDLRLGLVPDSYSVYSIDNSKLLNSLTDAPKASERQDQGLIISIPTVDGSLEEFEIFENNVVHESVKQYYSIKTFEGFSTERKDIHIRCDISSRGFQAMVYDDNASYVIEPLYKGQNDEHIVYLKNELKLEGLKCGHHGEAKKIKETESNVRMSTSLKTYKLALVATGEFGAVFGGSPCTQMNILNELAAGVNLINPIYKRDLAVQFELVSTNALVFCDANTDPFNTYGDQVILVNKNQTHTDNAIGTNNYDVGHLVAWAPLGGIAAHGVVCESNAQALGFSGSNISVNSLWVDYVAHEIGHQFNAVHNFASLECQTSVNNFRFEPGEGSSIMSYAGLCGNGYQDESDPYFHSASIGSMNAYITTSGTCGTTTFPGSGNDDPPVADAKLNVTIPKSTPFILVGSGSDPNQGPAGLTYVWEQYDGSSFVGISGPPDCNSTTDPLVKYIDPSSDSTRTIPSLTQVLTGDNNGSDWEKLSCVARTMNFRLVVRDNNENWGRIASDDMIVTVANTGPFLVTAPNGGEFMPAGSSQTVTWDVNGTNSHCSNVDVLISIDGGYQYAALAVNVPNDGAQQVSIPNVNNSTARILVQCNTDPTAKITSTFFDVSDADFTIEVLLPLDLLSFTGSKNQDGSNHLKWTTANEINTDHFEIQKSDDGHKFTSIDKVNTSSQNTASNNDYEYIDRNSGSDIVYYRLRQVDNDGEFEYSSTVIIKNQMIKSDIIVFPNPSTDFITISGANSDSQITITNNINEVVIQKMVTDEEKIDISGLVDGVYTIIINNNSTKSTQRFVKI